MPRAVITQDVYDRLLKAFREVPDNIARASRIAGCGLMMARRAWEAGWPGKPWAEPIRGVLQREQEAARDAVAREQERERERQEAVREQAKQDAIRARTEEGNAVRMARGNAIGILAVTNKMAVGALKLADVVRTALETTTSMDPGKAAQLIERVVRAARQAGELAHRAVVMERLVLGKPTEILGLVGSNGEDLTAEEALAEMAVMAEDRERFLRAMHPRDLRVIEGGKRDETPPLPPPPPTGTEK